MTYAVKTKNLAKTFGTRKAVDDLSFEVRQGELFALLGMNGAGKTTTLNILSGLVKAEGNAWVCGLDVKSDAAKIKGKINMSAQETSVGEKLTVKENLRFICRMYGMDKNKAHAAANEYMRIFALDERADERAEKLSGGLKRRLSIAMALATSPDVVFLDEPTLGLDVIARRELWKIIENLKGRATVILTTHYLEEAERLADTVAVMRNGRLCGLGTVDELKAQACTDSFEEAFLHFAGGDV